MTRVDVINGFLDRHIGARSTLTGLAGDASARRYFRLTESSDRRSLVLMDAAPERNAPVADFLRIAAHLTGLGLSAPEILAADEDLGLVLTEDFGDAVFAHLLEQSPNGEVELYGAAAEVLVELARAPVQIEVKDYSIPVMLEQVSLVFDWYTRSVAPDRRQKLIDSLAEALRSTIGSERCLALRDFHAENLIWLPERAGPARVGLLDFQDAVAAHPAYDLASLLRDVRRDVSAPAAKCARDLFVEALGYDRPTFDAAFAGCAIVRNLRILGIFSRLALRDGKTNYTGLLPRVWRLLVEDLGHPAFKEVRTEILKTLPEPGTKADQTCP